jgi:membrane-bound serine protease (ClpP class)
VRAAVLFAAISVSVVGGALTSDAAASTPSVQIVQVHGQVDPALSGYVRGSVEDAERTGSTVVLQLDSPGAYGDLAVSLADFLRHATVPVVTWVGPVGARAEGGAMFLVYGSDLAAMAPGAGIGPARPFDLATSASREPAAQVASNSARLAALAPGSGATGRGALLSVGRALPAGPALDAGAVALVAPDVPGLLRQLDGRTVQTARGPVTLATLGRPGRPVDVSFHEIGPWRRALHAVSTPAAVYVLLLLALWGIAFEFTQPGLGLAGIVGVLCLALAAYGLAVVPVHWAGIALILIGTGLQAADVMVRRLAWLTAIGSALFLAGSIVAWWGVAPAVAPALWLIVLATVAGFLVFGFGMTVALKARERIRTAQIGLVGLVGEARSDLDPEGGVFVKGTLWRGRSSNGRIPRGTRVRVRGVDGLVLRVEPDPGDVPNGPDLPPPAPAG